MMNYIIILLICITNVWTSYIPEKSNGQIYLFEANIKEAIEKLRDQLRNGIPESDIPPLEPLVFDNTNVNINEMGIGVNLNMTGQINGLLGFVLNNFKLGFGAPGGGFKLTYDLEFPSIQVDLTYYKMNLIINDSSFFGEGTILTTIDGLTLNGTGIVGYENPFLFLRDVNIELFLRDFKFKITGWLNNEQHSEEISNLLTEIVKRFIEIYHEPISSNLSKVILKYTEGKCIDVTNLL